MHLNLFMLFEFDAWLPLTHLDYFQNNVHVQIDPFPQYKEFFIHLLVERQPHCLLSAIHRLF